MLPFAEILNLKTIERPMVRYALIIGLLALVALRWLHLAQDSAEVLADVDARLLCTMAEKVSEGKMPQTTFPEGGYVNPYAPFPPLYPLILGLLAKISQQPVLEVWPYLLLLFLPVLGYGLRNSHLGIVVGIPLILLSSWATEGVQFPRTDGLAMLALIGWFIAMNEKSRWVWVWYILLLLSRHAFLFVPFLLWVFSFLFKSVSKEREYFSQMASIGLLVLAAQALYHYLFFGSVWGYNRMGAENSLIAPWSGLGTLLEIFLLWPEKPMLSLSVLALGVLALLWRNKQKFSFMRLLNAKREVAFPLMFAVLYVMFLLISRSATEVDPLNKRLLLPAFIGVWYSIIQLKNNYQPFQN